MTLWNGSDPLFARDWSAFRVTNVRVMNGAHLLSGTSASTNPAELPLWEGALPSTSLVGHCRAQSRFSCLRRLFRPSSHSLPYQAIAAVIPVFRTLSMTGVHVSRETLLSDRPPSSGLCAAPPTAIKAAPTTHQGGTTGRSCTRPRTYSPRRRWLVSVTCRIVIGRRTPIPAMPSDDSLPSTHVSSTHVSRETWQTGKVQGRQPR